MKEICIGDKIMWKENGEWNVITLDADAWIYYTLAPKGFIEIKALT